MQDSKRSRGENRAAQMVSRREIEKCLRKLVDKYKEKKKNDQQGKDEVGMVLESPFTKKIPT